MCSIHDRSIIPLDWLGLLSIAFLFILSACSRQGPVAVFLLPDGTERSIRLEVARTERQREFGLMFRDKLEDGRGMLFVFDRDSKPSFWMKNTFLCLDILFCSSDGVVKDIFEKVPPCPLDPCPLYTPCCAVRYAIEVRCGFAAKYHIKRGTKIRVLNLGDVIKRK